VRGRRSGFGNQTREQFEKLPEPIDHPTFRLEEVT